MRRCTRSACPARATATLTYVYADSTAVVGPLALAAEPGGYDLCRAHAERASAPRGWELIRLPDDPVAAVTADEDDLLALANAIREVGNRIDDEQPVEGALPDGVVVLAEKRHLRVIAER